MQTIKSSPGNTAQIILRKLKSLSNLLLQDSNPVKAIGNKTQENIRQYWLASKKNRPFIYKTNQGFNFVCLPDSQTSIDLRESLFSLYPINHRKIFELMLQLPVEYRANQYLPQDICKLEWSELLDIPFQKNHFTGLQRYKKLSKFLFNYFVNKQYSDRGTKLINLAVRDKVFFKKSIARLTQYSKI